jgi:alkylation response protein AidB-like acyl-CoA dehydrogenase
MPFELSDEQLAYRDSLRKFFETEAPLTALRERLETDSSAAEKELWRKCVELGLPAAFGAGKEGGVGPRELVIGAEEEGRALFPVALSDRLLCNYLFFTLLDPAARAAAFESIGREAAFADKLASGEAYGCVVLGRNADSSETLKLQRPRSAKSKNGAKLSGKLPYVSGSRGASVIVFSYESDIGVAALDGPGVSVSSAHSLDLSCAAGEIAFDGAPAVTLPAAGASAAVLARLLRAAQISGICDRVVGITADYVRQRKQFDVPVGGFQAVQHQLANAYLESESLAALTAFAGWAAAESPEQLALAAESAAVMALGKGSFVVETAVQLHGGIGFTWEYDLHLYLRRVKFLEALYGSGGAEVERLLSAASATLRTRS